MKDKKARLLCSSILASLVCTLVTPAQLRADLPGNNGIYISYPNEPNDIHASQSFIVGAIEPGHALTCQGEPVRVNAQGFFAKVVPLKHGINSFTLKLDGGEVQREVHIKREAAPPVIMESELKIGSVEPSQDLGLKPGDPITFKIKATPNSQVTVTIGSRQIVLNQSNPGTAKRASSKRPVAHVNTGNDIAYGEVIQRYSAASNWYGGYYRVQPSDQWRDVRLQVVLEHNGQKTVYNSTNRISTVGRTAVAQTARPITVVRLGPGLARTTPLDEGVRVEVDGWVGDQMRVAYSPSRHVWIDKKDLNFENGLTDNEKSVAPLAAPQAVVRTINVTPDQYGDVVRIPLDQRLPYQVEQKLSPNLLVLHIFGATSDTDWITGSQTEIKSDSGRSPIDHVSWRQPFDDQYEVTVHLNGSRQWGWTTKYDGTTLCLAVKRAVVATAGAKPLSGVKVCIDPGHGGSETGAIGCSGIKESTLNFAISQQLRLKLESLGATVMMTRDSDHLFVSLEDRTRKATEWGADFLISVHNNALPDGLDPWKEHGTSVYWYHPQSIQLARSLKDSTVAKLGFTDLGARYQNLALCRPTAMPSALVEVVFMINPDEYAKLIDESVQRQAAEGIADGLVEYLSN